MSRMAERHLAILRALSSGKVITLKELAKQTESTVISVRRGLVDLSYDYPIESVLGRNGGYRMAKSSSQRHQFLKTDEIEYICELLMIMPESEKRDTILKKLLPPEMEI